MFPSSIYGVGLHNYEQLLYPLLRTLEQYSSTSNTTLDLNEVTNTSRHLEAEMRRSRVLQEQTMWVKPLLYQEHHRLNRR